MHFHNFRSFFSSFHFFFSSLRFHFFFLSFFLGFIVVIRIKICYHLTILTSSNGRYHYPWQFSVLLWQWKMMLHIKYSQKTEKPFWWKKTFRSDIWMLNWVLITVVLFDWIHRNSNSIRKCMCVCVCVVWIFVPND